MTKERLLFAIPKLTTYHLVRDLYEHADLYRRACVISVLQNDTPKATYFAQRSKLAIDFVELAQTRSGT